MAETLQPGVSAAGVARRHGVHPQLLYTWRRQARQGQLPLSAEPDANFVMVVGEPDTGPASVSEPGAGAADEVVIEIGALRLRIGTGVPPERVAALISALQARR